MEVKIDEEMSNKIDDLIKHELDQVIFSHKKETPSYLKSPSLSSKWTRKSTSWCAT